MYFNQSTRKVENKVLFGKYRKLSVLGSGGMGQVYLIKNQENGKKYAMKVMEDNARSRRETEILKEISGIFGIPEFYEYKIQNRELYLIMEYISGVSMKEYIEKRGKLKEKELISWGKALCEILETLHKVFELAYMDLKPANIMVHPSGKLYLLDFGISVHFGEKMDCCGTKAFAAPEQFHPSGKADRTSDIYSLGKILKFCSLKEQREDMQKLIRKCTEKNPRNRYDTMEEVHRELCIISRKRNRRSIAAGSCTAVFFLLFTGGVIGKTWYPSQNKSEKILKNEEKEKISWTKKDRENWKKAVQEGKLELFEHLAKMGEERFFLFETKRGFREKLDEKQAWKLFCRYLVYQEEKGEDICKAYEKFIERYPKFGDAYMEYAIYLCRQKRWEKAREIYIRGTKQCKVTGDKAKQLKEKLGL